MPAAQESPELQPTFHEITVGIPLGELVKGHTRPSVSRLQVKLLQESADRYALMDGTDGAVFSSATPPQAETGQRNVAINGVHPFHTSAESQAHWKNVTDIVGVKRTAERVSIEETELVTDTLTPLFENGTPKLLDRIGSALRGIAKPVLVTQTAFGGAAGAVAVVPDNIDVAAHYQMANRPAQVETIVFDQASPSAQPSAEPSAPPSFEPSPIPSVEPSLDPNASPEPVDPCVTEPVPAAGEPEGEPIAAIDGGVLVDNTNTDPNQKASPAPGSSPEDKTTADAGTEGDLPPTDTDGDGVIDGDVDGDGDVDEDDKTAAADCDPVLTEAFLKAELPKEKEPIKFSFMEEAVEAPIGIGELKGIINAFYTKYPKALRFTDEYGAKFTPKKRNQFLNYCQKGHPTDPEPVIQQSRALSCASLLREFYFLARENKSQGMMDLAQSVYWYALASIKTLDPAYTIGEFLSDVEIRNQTIQG